MTDTHEYAITENERAHYVNSKKAHRFPTAEAERDWARTQSKDCSKCKISQPLTHFNGNTSGADPFDRDGLRLRRPECRACTRSAAAGKAAAAATAKRLGMSTKAPEGTPCELCGDTRSIVFDHDHTTEIFRGWLCNSCNRSIGVLGDTATGLLDALVYLVKGDVATQRAIMTTLSQRWATE